MEYWSKTHNFSVWIKAFGVCRNSAFAIETEATGCYDQMNIRVAFHVGAKGTSYNEDAHAHAHR